MSGGGMQAQQGVGTAASGGKGGQMGGPNMSGMSQAGTFDMRPAVMPEATAGGKGGEKPFVPDESGGRLPVSQPVVTSDPAAQPNAFETGLNAMNNSMNFMGGALGYQGDRLTGDYTVPSISPVVASKAKAALMSAPDRALYDYEAALANGQNYSAAQLSDKDIGDYMNPYTQNVIDTTMADLDKARMQAMNSTGAAATAGGAFGGDRHAIMEAQNNADYLDQVARSSAQLRNQGYQNAQAAAMGDVNAINQQRATNAGMAQQAAMANQAAQNARSQFMGSTGNANALQEAINNQNAQNQMSALNAQLAQQANTQNASFENANNQYNSGMRFAQDQFNAGQGQQDFMNQMSAAQNLYGMGNDRWNMGQNQVDKMAGVGGQIDKINQGYINQSMQAFLNQQNAPQQQYQAMLSAMSGMPNFGGTETYNPGFFDYASLAAGTAGSIYGGK